MMIKHVIIGLRHAETHKDNHIKLVTIVLSCDAGHISSYDREPYPSSLSSSEASSSLSSSELLLIRSIMLMNSSSMSSPESPLESSCGGSKGSSGVSTLPSSSKALEVCSEAFFETLA